MGEEEGKSFRSRLMLLSLNIEGALCWECGYRGFSDGGLIAQVVRALH